MRNKIADLIIKDIKKIKPNTIKNILDFKIILSNKVYPPNKESIMIGKAINTNKHEKILDYGCGSGILSLIAASQNAKVVAVDINKEAIENAKKNAKLNNLNKHITFIHGKNFDKINNSFRFDKILASVPYDNAKSKNNLEYSVYDYNHNMKKSLFKNAKKFLSEKGEILFTYSNKLQKITPIEKFCKGYKKNIIKREEDYLLYSLTIK